MAGEDEGTISLAKFGRQGIGFNWPNGQGGGVDLTGWTVVVADASPGLAAQMTVSVIDALNGRCGVKFIWAAALLEGRRNWFRLRATKTGFDPISMPRMWVEVS